MSESAGVRTDAGSRGAIVAGVLRGAGLLAPGEPLRAVPLPGGVSSRVWKVDTREHTLCVKQPREMLIVDRDWFAPLERSVFEKRWNLAANEFAPGSAPRVLCHDAGHMVLVTEYLEPHRFPWWKGELASGNASGAEAEIVARRIARIHAAAAGKPAVADAFPPNDIFRVMRLDAYFTLTARRHRDLAPRLDKLRAALRDTRITLIHGDFSPKNILVGESGPVFIDAECACLGDPAFDLAFCLNHLLLKCLWRRAHVDAYLDCFDAMASAYLAEVDWEEPVALAYRAAALLPALLLGRIDGRSPVEYLVDGKDRNVAREFARRWLRMHAEDPRMIAGAWRSVVQSSSGGR